MKPDQLLAEAGEFTALQNVCTELMTALHGMYDFLAVQRVTEPWLGKGSIWELKASGHMELKRTLLPENFRTIMKGGRPLPFVGLLFGYSFDDHDNTIGAWNLELSGGLVNAKGALFDRMNESLGLFDAKNAADINKSDEPLPRRREIAAANLAEVLHVQATLDAFPVVARPFNGYAGRDAQFYKAVRASRGAPKPGKVTGPIPAVK